MLSSTRRECKPALVQPFAEARHACLGTVNLREMERFFRLRKFQPSQERSHPQLTPRETEVIELAAKGYRSKEIADSLSFSTQTVETHFRNIYEKLHVRSRAEAVAKFLRN